MKTTAKKIKHDKLQPPNRATNTQENEMKKKTKIKAALDVMDDRIWEAEALLSMVRSGLRTYTQNDEGLDVSEVFEIEAAVNVASRWCRSVVDELDPPVETLSRVLEAEALLSLMSKRLFDYRQNDRDVDRLDVPDFEHTVDVAQELLLEGLSDFGGAA